MILTKEEIFNLIKKNNTPILNYQISNFKIDDNILIFDVFEENTFQNVTGYIKKNNDTFNININEDIPELNLNKGSGVSFFLDTYEVDKTLSCDFIKTLFAEKNQELLNYIGNIEKKIDIKKEAKKQTILVERKTVSNQSLNFANLNFGELEDYKEEAFYLNAGTKPVLLFGPQATGKSRSMRRIVEKLKQNNPNISIEFFSKELTKEMDRSDLLGMPSIKENSYTYEIMSKAFFSARDGNIVVLGIDEVFRIKDNSPLFAFSGDDYYKLNTGRQIDFVELELDNGNNMWFQLYDTKPNNNVKLENKKIKIDENKYFNLINCTSKQIVEDASALGAMPIIRYKDYEKYNLDDLLVSSFNSQEIIKAPIKNMLVILAGNVGNNFIQNFTLGMDLAWDSRMALVETKPFSIKFMSKTFEKRLLELKEKDLIKWKVSDLQVEKLIKEYSKRVEKLFTQIEKMEKNEKTISTNGKIDFRVFNSLADSLSRLGGEPELNDLANLIKRMKFSILDFHQSNNGVVIEKKAEEIFNITIEELIGKEKTLTLDTEAKNEIQIKEDKNKPLDLDFNNNSYNIENEAPAPGMM